MKEALRSSETLVLTRATWGNIPEDTAAKTSNLAWFLSCSASVAVETFSFAERLVSNGHCIVLTLLLLPSNLCAYHIYSFLRLSRTAYRPTVLSSFPRAVFVMSVIGFAFLPHGSVLSAVSLQVLQLGPP
jgi:hypothetical protein